MKKSIRKIALACLMATATMVFTACTSEAPASSKTEPSAESKASSAVVSKESKASESSTESKKALSGKITMAGSTSMEKLANAFAEAYMEDNSGVTVTAEFTGSSAGIESLLAGSVDVGNASRELKDSETTGGAVENVVAIDGIAIVVNPANTAENLTKEQLTKIYTGEITNWSALGGSDEPIVVIGREAGSGTRGAFEEILKVEDACKYALELDSTGTVIAKTAATAGAIGYVSLDMVDTTVKSVKLDGIAATPENIKGGTYFLSRPFVMATKGEVSAQSELVKSFFEYVYSDAGTELIESIGLIATK